MFNVIILLCLIYKAAGAKLLFEYYFSTTNNSAVSQNISQPWQERNDRSASYPSSGPATGCSGQPEDGYLNFNSQLCTTGLSADVVFEYSFANTTQLSAGCLEFSYYMWGATVQILAITEVSTFGTNETIWIKHGSVDNVWYREKVTLKTNGTKIIFTATCGEPGTSDIAIDNITLVDGACPGIGELPFTCTFEKEQGFCGFRFANDDRRIWWHRTGGPNPFRNSSRLTGPVWGFNDSNYFLLMYSPDVKYDDQFTSVYSPEFNIRNASCLSFMYFMYGDISLNKLEVLTESELLWVQYYSLGDRWQEAKITLHRGITGHLEFRGYSIKRVQASELSDIALDEVKLSEGVCTGDNADYYDDIKEVFCDFEQSMCGFQQDILNKEIFGWRLWKGVSLSRRSGIITGPSEGAKRTDGYLYLYSNDASTVDQAARLISPYVRQRSKYVCLQFDYYMFGTDVNRMNFMLIDDEKNLREIWEQSYDQGEKWRSYSKTLEKYQGEIILEGWTSVGKEADLAIDNIRISPGACLVDEGKIVSYPYSCDFEDDFCHWIQRIKDKSHAGWRRATMDDYYEDYKGPSGYALIAEPVKYLWTSVVTPEFTTNETYLCFTMFYYMHGSSMNLRLRDNKYTRWFQTYDQGAVWRNVSVTIDKTQNCHIIATYYSISQTVVAVDNITVTEGACSHPTNLLFKLPYFCDFEYDWCNMSQTYGDNGDWRWVKGISPKRRYNEYTGPLFDNTLRNDRGHYAYFSSLTRKIGDTSFIKTPYLKKTYPFACLKFNYHMYGKDVGMLKITQIADNVYKYIWHRSFSLGDKWQYTEITLEQFHGIIQFEGNMSYRAGQLGDIGLDDISIMAGKCNSTPDVHYGTPYLCDFEDNFCNLKQHQTTGDSYEDDGDFRWQTSVSLSRLHGLLTGPLYDHTYGEDGVSFDLRNLSVVIFCEYLDYRAPKDNCIKLPDKGKYLYYRQSDFSNRTDFRYDISTPVLEMDNATVCLSFWYHMYGYDVNNLTVYNERLNGTLQFLWIQRYNQRDVWWQVNITIVDIEGTTLWRVHGGNSSLADIALDDINIDSGACSNPTGIYQMPLPWICDFDDTFCDMVHTYDYALLDADVGEWRWEIGKSKGRKQNLLTGPIYDANDNDNGGYALYHAADIPMTKHAVKTILKTPYLNFSSPEVCLNFSYHMYGSNVNRLSVYVKRIGSQADYIWHSSYEQSDKWYYYDITIRNFSGQLMFEATYGFGILGDIALDDIAVESGACVDAVGDCLQELPYLCDFEDGYCNMQQNVSNKYDWRRCTKKPASFESSTYYTGSSGPRTDHTLQNGKGYSLFIQAYYADKSLWYSAISTPKFDIAFKDVCIDFYYHMYGKDVYMLELYWIRELQAGSEMVYLWHQSFDQGNIWLHFYRTIRSFSGRISFVGYSGWSIESFIALDDVKIYEGSCHGQETVTLPVHCTFEEGYCFFIQNRLSDAGDFHRPAGMALARKENIATGPLTDHTFECSTTVGNHVYLYKGQCTNCTGETSILDTMPIHVRGMLSICVQFWYFLYGSTIDSLRLKVINDINSKEVWSVYGDQGEQWHLMQKEIPVRGLSAKLQVVGVYGEKLDSDISIDDFRIYEGPCAAVLNCSMPPPTVNHSTFVEHGSMINYTCELGYRFPDDKRSDVIRCDNGEWRCPLPDCQLIHCPDLPMRSNLHWSTTETQWNTRVYASCDYGYKLPVQQQSSIICLDNGEWSNDLSKLSCHLILCEPLPSMPHLRWILNGSVVQSWKSTMFAYMSTVEAVCDDTHYLNNSSLTPFRCTYNEQWSVNVTELQCLWKNCPLLPEIPHLHWSSNETRCQTVVSPSCDYYYQLVPVNFVLQCTTAEEWNVTDVVSAVNCELIRCQPLPEKDYGNWSPDENAVTTQTKLECWDNATLVHDVNNLLTCLISGEWDNDPSYLICRRKQCSALPELPHLDWSTDERFYQTVVYPICQQHYTLSQEAFPLVCLSSEEWNYSDTEIQQLRCNLIHCPPLPVIQDVTWSTENTSVTAIVTPLCNISHDLSNNSAYQLECTESGEWSFDPRTITCQSEYCPPLPQLPHLEWSTDERLYNTVVYPICHQYYTLSSTGFTLQCKSTGAWNYNETELKEISCNLIHCPALPVLDGVIWSTYNTSVTVIVQALCNSSYQLSNRSVHELECTEAGEWSVNPRTVICQKLVTYQEQETYLREHSVPEICRVLRVNNAIPSDIREENELYIVNYTCLQGYLFPDNKSFSQIYCDKYGIWHGTSDISDFSCNVLHCPNIRLTPGTLRDSNDTHYNSIITYYCDIGYKMVDGSQRRTLICRSDGKWHTLAPVCQPVTCPKIEVAPDFSLSTSIRRSYRDVVRVTCADGLRTYDGRDQIDIKCLSSAKWSFDRLLCTDKQYKPFPYVNQSSSMIYISDEMIIANITCGAGFKYPNRAVTNIMTCNRNTYEWDYENFMPCIATVCDPFEVYNASKSTDLVGFGISIDIHCFEGYTVEGYDDYVPTQIVTCQESGVWSADVVKCREIICPPPEDVYNAYTVTKVAKYTLGSEVTYVCLPGKRFSNGKINRTVTCGVNEQWSNIFDNCTERRCPPPPAYAHMSFYEYDVSIGGLAYAVCDDGYTFQGTINTTVIQCTEMLTWTDVKHECSPIECIPLPTENRKIMFLNNSTLLGSKVQLIANPYYKFVYSGTDGHVLADIYSVILSCQANRLWNISLQHLDTTLIECPPVPRVAFAKPDRVVGPFIGKVMIGYTCDDFYRFPTKTKWTVIKCLPNATWEEITPCELITCPNPRPWDDLVIKPENYSTILGTTLHISCSEGYLLENGKKDYETTCIGLGDWSVPLSSCRNNTNIRITPTESASAFGMGMIFSTIIGIVITAIVVSDVIYYRRDILELFQDVPRMPKVLKLRLRTLK